MAATVLTCLSSAWSTGLWPMTSSTRRSVSGLAAAPGAAALRAMALWMESSRSSGSNGLVKNSCAPALIAFTDMGMFPWPVTKMMGICESRRASSCCTSMPDRPGRFTSRIKHAGVSREVRSRKAAPEA